MSKIIKAIFTGRFCKTQRVFQWDTDDKLQFVNVDLPANYTVDFSNSKTGDSVSVLATSDTVQIPPDLFVPGSEIYAWIWLSDSNGGHTRCEATIPIDPRARRTGTEPTPAQASAWDEAVDTLNETIEGIPAVINSALTDAKESGEFDGADGADGNGVWYVDVQYTRTTGAGVQAQLDHMVGRPGATPAAGDLCVVSDGRFGAVTIITPRVAVVPVLGDLSGADGYSPVVTITEIEGGHRITITDEAHPDGQSFDVLDGQGGGSGDYDDLTNKPKIGGVTLSGNLSAAELGLSPAGAYVKPSGGIPNSDLAEDAKRGYTSEERVTLVPEGTYTFSADAGDGAGYAYGLDFSSVPDMDFDSLPESVMIVVDGVEYEKQYNASESEGTDYMAAIYGTTDIPTNDCALIIELNLLRQGITEEAITPIVRLNVIEGEEQHTLSAYFIRQPVTTTPDFDAAVAKSSAEALAEKLDTGGDAYRAASIPMGELDSTSTATVMTATIDGITELRDGVCMWLRNGVIASAAGVTLNINSLGAKPIYNSLSGTVVTTTFVAASTYLFVYNTTRVNGGCWDMVYGYDTNTTYTPVKLGFGYATCSTAEATAAKTAALSSYTLTTGGIVAIKFNEDVPANATLNINSKGAKAIYYKGAAITAGVIKAGDTVTMIYSTYYHVLSIDRDIPAPSYTAAEDVTSNFSSSGSSEKYARADHIHRLDASVFETILNEVLAVNMPVILYDDNNNGVVIQQSPQTLMNIYQHQPKLNLALIAPPNYNNYPVIFTASSLNTTTGELHLTGITGGVLYEATLLPGLDPIDNDGIAMVGTMTTTDLALPSAQGVSF